MRIKTNSAAATAAVTATALVGLAAAPAVAAPEDPAPSGTSKGTASALQLGLGGQNQSATGTVVATNDGSGEQKSGQVNPPIGVLSGQQLLNAGVLSQDAAARDNGTAEACSGVAGEGGSVAQIGSSQCITPGEQPVGLTIANLDLSDLQLAEPGTALDAINQIGDPLLDPVTEDVLSQVIDPVQEQLGGSTGITGSFDVLASQCQAGPDSASGDATITNPSLDASFMGQNFDLVELPANPPPNTEVPVELDVVVTTILDAVRTQLNQGLEGALAPATELTDALQEQVVDAIVAPLSEQLQPLQDNVLKLVLNQQNRPADDRIEVTALSLDVLPAAEEFTDSPLLEGDIAEVTCDGANVAAEPEPTPEPTPEPSPEPEKEQPVPTTITSGTDGGAQGEARATDDTELTAATGAGAAAVALAALVSGGLLLRRRTHR